MYAPLILLRGIFKRHPSGTKAEESAESAGGHHSQGPAEQIRCFCDSSTVPALPTPPRGAEFPPRSCPGSCRNPGMRSGDPSGMPSTPPAIPSVKHGVSIIKCTGKKILTVSKWLRFYQSFTSSLGSVLFIGLIYTKTHPKFKKF